jgi:hypothetical protein
LGGMDFCPASARRAPPSEFSSFSTNGAFRSYNFPGPIPEAIPSFVFHHQGTPPPPGGHPHVPASVAHTTAHTVSPLRSLPRGDISTLSASDLTLSGWPAPTAPPTPPVVSPTVPPAAVSSPPPAPSSSSSSCTSLLKLIHEPPSAPAPAPVGTPAPAPAPAAASPSPRGRVASTDCPTPGAPAPSGLTAAVKEDEYSSDGDSLAWRRQWFGFWCPSWLFR